MTTNRPAWDPGMASWNESSAALTEMMTEAVENSSSVPTGRSRVFTGFRPPDLLVLDRCTFGIGSVGSTTGRSRNGSDPGIKLGGRGIPPYLASGTSYSRSTTSNNRSCTSQLRSGTFLPGSTTLLGRIQASNTI